MNKYTCYDSRGFGTFNPTLGRGVYGVELQKAFRRQADGLKHTLWELEIRAPISNRIPNGMALCRWGSEDGGNGTKEAIGLNDCFPLDSHSFEQYRLSWDKLGERGKPPQTVHMSVKTARQQSRLYASVYGEERNNERLGDVGRLSEIHEECPEFFTPAFLVETWGLMVYQYDSCVSEGVNFIPIRYDEGVTFGKIRRYAQAPDPGTRGGMEIYTNI